MPNSNNEEYPIGVFISTYTGDELFLADHIIQGKKILPGMAYLEIARAAIATSVVLTDKQMIVLKDSIFIQAILVTEKRSIEVQVYPGLDGEFGVEVSTDQGIHFQTKVFVKDKQELLKEIQIDKLNIHEIDQRCVVLGPTKQQFYENMAKRQVILGPSHRGIESIKIGSNEALIKLSLPNSSKRAMVMDPGMLDSVIQSAIALSDNPESNVVPFAVRNTKIFGALTDEMYAHVIKNEDSVDYVIADLAGEIKVVINGFVAREIDLNSKEDQLVFYKPKWQVDDDFIEVNNLKVTLVEEQPTYASLVKSIITTVQKLAVDRIDQEHTLVVNVNENEPAWRGIVGLLKTVILEYPKIKCILKYGNKAVRLDYDEMDMTAQSEYKWEDNKTILITGGMGGIGRIIAQDIAHNSKGCTIILVGRSKLSNEKKEFINSLEALGVKAIYVTCDVTNQAEVANLIAEHTNITGIIHGSGINRDNLINNKNLEEVDEVLEPKVLGLKYLDQASESLKLDYFITLSSIAGALGNVGQVDYAAANAYMDAYMENRMHRTKNQQCYGKSISINCPLWENGGMKLDETIKQNLRQVLKIKPMPDWVGLTALKTIMAGKECQAVVMFGNRKTIVNLFNNTIGETTKGLDKEAVKVEVNELTTDITKRIKLLVAEHLKLQSDNLDEILDWADFGFDSILLASFINRFNAQYNMSLLPTVLFENSNINEFSRYLADSYPDQFSKNLSSAKVEKQSKEQELSGQMSINTLIQKNSGISSFAQSFKNSYKSNLDYRDKDIAIVGMSCRIAGARNSEEFWKILDQGKDMISEIPSDRWDWREYPDVRKWGSFIDGVAEFDSLFFGISPAEAIYMAPEQRLMMQYVWECIEDAGYNIDDLKGTNTGLFIGCGPSGYSNYLKSMPIEAYSATGMVPSVGPNRISFMMDWHGPSNPVETACSSALVALHRAVEAIRLGHCNHAIIGGVNLLLSPDGYISFTKSGMLCEDGRCKTFSAKANGYVRGEGVGMLMLKPLQAAIEDGNVIYAVVKGSAENHGGRSNSLTAPNPKSQAAVIKRAIEDADIDFSRFSYIECHGTGTPLGDPIEIEGLKMVASELLKNKDDKCNCKLGSIKSNIGHLEYAAGVVGLIKVILQIKHKKIVKSLHSDTINPYINLENTPFTIAQQASDWEIEPGKTRVAGVSSFGFGGVNAHVVLEEYSDKTISTQQNKDEDRSDPLAKLIILSAKSEESLIDYVTNFRNYIEKVDKSPITLKRIAYTLQVGRSEMPERLAFIVKSFDEWIELIDAFLASKGEIKDSRIYRGTIKSGLSNNNVELLDGKVNKDFIKQLLDSDKYDEIAQLWILGTKINWQHLYL